MTHKQLLIQGLYNIIEDPSTLAANKIEAIKFIADLIYNPTFNPPITMPIDQTVANNIGVKLEDLI